MPDPIDELSNFEPGVPLSPMPAAEVRRRGDRLRRRNTGLLVGGAVAAVVLAVVPVAVLAGDDGGGAPQPAPAPALSDEALLTADELPTRDRLTGWEEIPAEGQVVGCAPAPPAALDAETAVRRDFGADVAEAPGAGPPVSVVRTAVLQFADATVARQQYDQAQRWILGCPGGDQLADKSAGVHGFELEGGQGEWRRRDFYAPDVCTECDAIRFDRMGVAQFGDRVLLVSLAEVGGPLEPEGLDASMDELFQAAVAKAGGVVTGASGSDAGGPSPTIPDDFPLSSGMPDVSGNEDYRFDPPSPDAESMLAAGELTACGDGVPETAPDARLTTRLTSGAEAQVRELQLLPREQDAVTYVAHLRNLYQSCPSSDSGGAPPTFTTTVAEGAFGEESLDIRSASDGIGRVAITVVRIGNAVLVETINDEGAGSDVDALATAAHENLADVMAAMCEFAEAGC